MPFILFANIIHSVVKLAVTETCTVNGKQRKPKKGNATKRLRQQMELPTHEIQIHMHTYVHTSNSRTSCACTEDNHKDDAAPTYFCCCYCVCEHSLKDRTIRAYPLLFGALTMTMGIIAVRIFKKLYHHHQD